MGHFGGHADAFAQCGVRVDGFANVHAVRTHLNRQGNLANHVARMGADNAAAQDAVGLRIKQQLGKALVAAIGNGAARGGPGEQALLDPDDGPQSVVWDEAENRMHVQKALMEYLLLGRLA